MESSVKLIGTNGSIQEYYYDYKWVVRVAKETGWYDTGIPLITGVYLNIECLTAKCDFLIQAVPDNIVASQGRREISFRERDEGVPGYITQVDFQYTLRLKIRDEARYVEFAVFWRDMLCSNEEGNPAHRVLHATHRLWAKQLITRMF